MKIQSKMAASKKTKPTPSKLTEMVTELSRKLQNRVHAKPEILNKYYYFLKEGFGFSDVNIYLLDSSDDSIETTIPEKNIRPLPDSEKKWLLKNTRQRMLNNSEEPVDIIYISDRHTSDYTDKDQIKKDQAEKNYVCDDGMYIVLVSEEKHIAGIVFINNWAKKTRIDNDPDYHLKIAELIRFSSSIITALDTFLIHKKIEGLLSNQKELKQKIKKDEKDLQRRVQELTVLYETSNTLGYSIDYSQIVNLIVDGLHKGLEFDICSIFLLGFSSRGELITRINRPVEENYLTTVHNNTLEAMAPFVKEPIDIDQIKIKNENRFVSNNPFSEKNPMKSFANVPLIFKEEVIGIINVCSETEDAFQRNETTFLHTMANQLSAHLGRLKIIKNIEKSKMASMIKSLPDGVIMINETHELEIINPAARELLEFNTNQPITNKQFLKQIQETGLRPLYEEALRSTTFPIFKETTCNGKVLAANVNKVQDANNNRVGTVIIFRDVTEIQRSDRIKTQRLDIISKVNLIIKSIVDLDNLLSVLMEFILNVANAEMGSIQLRKGKTFFTKVHSNFPDKIRRGYQFHSGETISEHVTDTKECSYLKNYQTDSRVKTDTKIAIESYICIPIIVKHNLVGIVNIVRKQGNPYPMLTDDDIETLKTITSLSGTAIHNALLYQDTIKKQKLAQELKVAYDIQSKLLPEHLPVVDNVDFGALSIPAKEIGGDYYDFFTLDNGDVGIIIADIVGKGVPAGLFMAMLKSILHTHIRSIKSPKAAMKKINEIIYDDPVIDKFMPVFYGVLNTKTRRFKYCNAGHEPGIIISEKGFRNLDTNGFPLGGLKESEFGQKETTLSKGDFLVLFTDGVVEARNGLGESYGEPRLITSVKNNLKLSASHLVETIYGDVKKFAKDIQDDVTLVGIKIDNIQSKNKEKEKPLQIIEKKVSSSKSNIKVIRAEVESIAKNMGFSESNIFNLKLAINEAQANVIEHAYFGAENGEILFKFFVYVDRLVITIKDYGPGMSQKTIKGEEHLEELEGSGLGVFLIKTVMDDVKHNRSARIGTELILTKYTKERPNGNN